MADKKSYNWYQCSWHGSRNPMRCKCRIFVKFICSLFEKGLTYQLCIIFVNDGKICVQLWTVGGARRIELKTPNLLWLMFRLFSIHVPAFITFPLMVLWAAKVSRAEIPDHSTATSWYPKHSCIMKEAAIWQIEPSEFDTASYIHTHTSERCNS